MVPDHDPVYKISIIPRGRALGVTMFLPEDDRYSYSKRRLESQISSLFGGRIAEEVIFGPDAVTTGAANDIERATQIARNMVTRWGLSDKMGPLTYQDEEGEIFLGHSVTKHSQISTYTQRDIDEEVRVIVDRSYTRASDIINGNKDKLHLMAEALIKYETIGEDQIKEVMKGKAPSPPEDWSDSDSTTGGDPIEDQEASAADADGKIGGPAGQH